MKKNLSLVIIIKNIDGGTGTFLKQLLNIGYPVKNISVLALEEPSFHLINKTKILYCRDKFNKQDPSGRISAIKILIQELIFLIKNIKKSNPDIIISIDTHCNLLTCIAKIITGIKSKIILTIHNNTSGVFKYKHHLFPVWLIRFCGHLLFSLSDCIVGVSKGVVFDIHTNFHPSVPVYLIYYGLEKSTKKLSINKNKSLFSQKIPLIITISRLAGQKDILTLINSSIYLFKQGIKHKLMVIGDGKEKNDYQKIIKNNNLDEKIFLLGWKRNIYDYLKKADIFVLSTHYEGFPYVLLEAMNAGLPIIATDVCYGPKELLGKNKYGLLIKFDDYLDLAAKIKLLINNTKLRSHYSRQSLERINDFSESKMLQKYKQIILHLFETYENI